MNVKDCLWCSTNSPIINGNVKESFEFGMVKRTHEVRILPIIIGEKITPMLETISIEAIASPVVGFLK